MYIYNYYILYRYICYTISFGRSILVTTKLYTPIYIFAQNNIVKEGIINFRACMANADVNNNSIFYKKRFASRVTYWLKTFHVKKTGNKETLYIFNTKP